MSELGHAASLGQVNGAWVNAAFTPDGNSLVVVRDDGSAAVWPVSTAAWERHACAVAGRSLTREEWNRFVSGHSYAATCPGEPG